MESAPEPVQFDDLPYRVVGAPLLGVGNLELAGSSGAALCVAGAGEPAVDCRCLRGVAGTW